MSEIFDDLRNPEDKLENSIDRVAYKVGKMYTQAEYNDALQHRNVLEFQSGFNAALIKEPCGHTVAELLPGDSRKCGTCVALLERAAVAMVQQREADAQLIENLQFSYDGTTSPRTEAYNAIRNAPLASAPEHEWLEKHDVEVAKAWVEHANLANQANLTSQLAVARAEAYRRCAAWWRSTGIQHAGVVETFDVWATEAEATAREGKAT